MNDADERFDYRAHIVHLDKSLAEWARAQPFFEECPEPSALDPNGIPYVVLAIGVTITSEEMGSYTFVPITRRLYHRTQHTLLRLGATGEHWIRRWPQMGWEPPRKANRWGRAEPGLLKSTVRLSRKDGAPVDDELGMRIKPEGEPIWRDEKLRDQYA